jgi:hypothetical protein
MDIHLCLLLNSSTIALRFWSFNSSRIKLLICAAIVASGQRLLDTIGSRFTDSKRSHERRSQPGLLLRDRHLMPASQIIEWAFGKRMTPAERLRKHQRALEKTQRELDRERTKLEQQEKKLVADIKKNAKNGQMGAVKVQAKDLVRTRRYITKFYQMRTQLQAISLRIQVLILLFQSSKRR